MRKLFSLIAAVLFAGSMMAAEAKVTLDFTDAGWNFPSAYTKTAESYTNGGFTVAFSESNNGHKYLTVSQSDLTPTGIIFGKQDASISFPAFDFAVGKILVHYVSAQGGANTVHNIFVGDEAVSAAETGCKVTETKSFSTFEIAANAQAAGTIYVLKVTSAHNMQVSKVEFFEAGEEPEEGPWAEISFKAAVAKDALPADSIFKSNLEGFQAKIADSGNKMEIDENPQRFGTAEEYVKYGFRLKTGGGSSADKNFITVSVPAAGYLGIAPRSGSSSATDRKLFVIQGTDTLFNDIIQESQAIEVMEDTTKVKVYPFILIPVKAGDVVLRYSAALYFYAFGFVEALTKPEEAPAAPEQAEEDVMAIYCNHYKTNNANFAISGWAGGYDVLDLDGTTAAFWTNMTWECIIDPAHTNDPHDFSAFENVHVDMWAPLPAKIKFAAEAVAGGDYKDGVKLDLMQGWNSFDIPLAEWPREYDFKNLKCLVLEQYQTPTGQSLEHNPFAVANIYFWKTPSVDTLSCAKAAEDALAGETYEAYVKGYVTEIAYAWKNGSMSFWMADTKDGGKVFEAFKCAIEKEEDAVRVGDLVKAHGTLTKYNTTPELAEGCTVEILERAPEVVPQNLGEKTIAEFLELKNKIDTCILTGTVKNIVMDTQDPTKPNVYGNFDLEDATASVYIYGLLTPEGEAKKFPEMGIVEGDVIIIKAIYSEYNSAPQVKNAILVRKKGQGIDNTGAEVKVEKFFRDGQLIIRKNGVEYNAQGAIVR